LDAGLFVALGKKSHFALDLLQRVRQYKAVSVPASTIGEFWRHHRGLSESRFGLLKPSVVPVDEQLAKQAGELLNYSSGRNTLDAIVVALAERLRAQQISRRT